MRSENIIKVALLTLLLTTSVVASNAYAGSKQKPPIAETVNASALYDSIISLFNF
ncbi:hypothetical protein [Aliiglaciecola sp. NS0011-25]|uniref:hypothetical protein n=1 Tax=Aliiglaciecola sp. NS0011-25 TaxID=3127654 RepID=UPI003106A2D2